MAELETAQKILKNDGLIIFPTETVYGIGCLMSSTVGIERLYKIKDRDGKPTSALFKDLNQVKQYVKMNKESLLLAKAFWPGPLTLCLPAKENVPEKLLGTGATFGVRINSNSWLRKLLNTLDAPLLAPSANFKHLKPTGKFAEIDKGLFKLVDYVVNIEPDHNKVSTVVSFATKPYTLVRVGAITKEAIDEILGKKLIQSFNKGVKQ